MTLGNWLELKNNPGNCINTTFNNLISMKKLFNPVSLGAAAGFAACIGFVYYVLKALSPGLAGAVGITLIGMMFGIFVGLSGTVLFFLMDIKKLFRDLGSCTHCERDVPKQASFCPHCGRRPAHVKMINIWHDAER